MTTEIENQSTEERPVERICPAEGWHVLHLFYQVDQGQWQLLSEEEKLESKTNLTRLVQEIRATRDTQLLACSVVTPKADIAFMLLTPDLHDINAFEKRLTLSLGPDVLTPAYSYLSITAQDSEKTSTDRGGQEDNELYPELPDWPVFSFSNLVRRRGEEHNWYTLETEARREIMDAHSTLLEKWSDWVQHITTTSTGLDDAERSISLFARDTTDIVDLLEEARHTAYSSQYAELGDFYLGIQLPLDELFRRVEL
ncbi:MAG: chlorite dismutase family protein [Verrucomicrobiales bacterium]